MSVNLRKYSGSEIANIVFGLIVLVVGVTQISHYFSGINPPDGSSALSVPANPALGAIQIVEVIATLLLVASLAKFAQRWFQNVASIILVIFLVVEAGMAIGYSGL